MALSYLVANVVVVSILWWRLRVENKVKSEREAAGEVDEVLEGRELQGDEKLSWKFVE